MSEEIWKPIEGFPYYEVSSFGRIKSLTRTLTVKNFAKSRKTTIIVKKSKILKSIICEDGYSHVNLYNNKKTKYCLTHTIVAKTFIANPKNYTQINHIDGVKTNNSVSNLEWTTSYINHQHAMKLGLTKTGSDKYNAKLNEKIVQHIIKEVKIGISQVELAKKYNVSTATICKVVKGITWSHATGVPKDDRAYKIRRKYE